MPFEEPKSRMTHDKPWLRMCACLLDTLGWFISKSLQGWRPITHKALSAAASCVSGVYTSPVTFHRNSTLSLVTLCTASIVSPTLNSAPECKG